MTERVLGPMFTTWTLEESVRTVLATDTHAMAAYIAEAVRQSDLGDARVERPRSVLIAERATRLAEKQLPALIVVSPGTVGEPRRDGNGNTQHTWSLVVAAVTQASNERVARQKASILAAAIRSCVTHGLPRTDDRVINVRWLGESSDEVPLDTDQRSRAVSACLFEIDVFPVMNTDYGPGPWEFDPDPETGAGLDLGDLGTVEETLLTITPVEEIA